MFGIHPFEYQESIILEPLFNFLHVGRDPRFIASSRGASDRNESHFLLMKCAAASGTRVAQ